MKNICKFICLAYLVVLNYGCSNDDDQKEMSANISSKFKLLVKDTEGNNLVTDKYRSSIKLYTENENGELEPIYYGHLDYPRNYIIEENLEGEDILSIFPHFEYGYEFANTYIEWTEGDMDTIKTAHRFSNWNVMLEKVWFNDKLIIDMSNNKPPFYELIKE